MTKRLMLAAAALATLATMAFTSVPAEAKVYVYMGVPYYGYQVAPHWRYYNGRGWYDPYKYNYIQPVPAPGYGRMSCGQARQAVKANGYYNVVTVDCYGKIYNFNAWRNGKPHSVSVNSVTGAVWKNY